MQIFLRALILAASFCSLAAGYRTQNFVVTAPTNDTARAVARAAENYRQGLAKMWLGKELADWSQPCPIRVQIDELARPQGMTSYSFRGGRPEAWDMALWGELEIVVQSVLPHEVMHTILATYFGRPIPRWADEGICTMVEAAADLSRHDRSVLLMVSGNSHQPLTRLFGIERYPRDVQSFYMQSYSVTRYLIAQGGRRKFLKFLDEGHRQRNWETAVRRHYGFTTTAHLEEAWRGSLRLQKPIRGRLITDS